MMSGGGIVIVFGVIHRLVISPLVRSNVRVNATAYQYLIEGHVFLVLKKCDIYAPVSTLDNFQCPKANLVMNYLNEQEIGIFDL